MRLGILIICVVLLAGCGRPHPPSWILGEWEKIALTANQKPVSEFWKFTSHGAYHRFGRERYSSFRSDIMNEVWDKSDDSSYFLYTQHNTDSQPWVWCFSYRAGDTLVYYDSLYQRQGQKVFVRIAKEDQ